MSPSTATECHKLEDYLTGTMPKEERVSFAAHLGACQDCFNEAQIWRIFRTEKLRQDAAKRSQEAPAAIAVASPASPPAPEVEVPTAAPVPARPSVPELAPPPPTTPGWLTWVAPLRALFTPPRAFGMASAAAMVLLLVLAWRTVERPFIAEGISRGVEVRFAHRLAGAYRPYDPPRSAGAQLLAPSSWAMAWLDLRGDRHGTAIGHALAGSLDLAQSELAAGGETAERLSDRAAVAIVAFDRSQGTLRKSQSGLLNQALTWTERALELRPGYAPALWNRGLALKRLGLTLHAAETFEQVARLREAGWSQEAERIAKDLRSRDDSLPQSLRQWGRARDAGEAWVLRGEAPPQDLLTRFPGLMRLYFYDAARAAPSLERAAALRSVAHALDEQTGRAVLAPYLDRVLHSDFSQRAPIAADYAALFSQPNRPEPEVRKLLAGASEIAAWDIWLGAARLSGLLRRDALVQKEYAQRLDQMPEDAAWFRAIFTEASVAEQIDKLASTDRDSANRLEQVLNLALAEQEAAPTHFRTLHLKRLLVALYERAYRLREAQQVAEDVREAALAHSELGHAYEVLWDLTEISRQRQELPLAGAYVRELLLVHSLTAAGDARPEAFAEKLDCEPQRFYGETRATLALPRGQADVAEHELSTLRASCPNSLTGLGVAVLADLPHFGRSTLAEEPRVRAWFDRLCGQGCSQPTPHYQLGSYLLNNGRAEHGLPHLQRAIDLALARRSDDVEDRKALAYARRSLILNDGAQGHYEQALRGLSKSLDAEVPKICSVGIARDDRLELVITQDAAGQLQGHFRRDAPNATQNTLTIPPQWIAALQPCARVDVLALPPDYGRASILPANIAWAYRLGAQQTRVDVKGGHPVAVTQVQPPVSAGLTLLAGTTLGVEEHDAVILRGAQATPRQFLSALPQASEIVIDAHGLREAGGLDSARLALSAEPGGTADSYLLTADQVSQVQLRYQPAVYLATCHGAMGAPYLHTQSSLLAAFRRAGARAVIASTEQIPDAEGSALFRRLRERVQAGQQPAIALRDERMRVRSQGAAAQWVDSLIATE